MKWVSKKACLPLMIPSKFSHEKAAGMRQFTWKLRALYICGRGDLERRKGWLFLNLLSVLDDK